MPIVFNCACGKTLRVPDAHAGRRAKCPVCAAVVGVPAPEPEPVLEVVEDAPPPSPLPPASPNVHGKPRYDDDDDDKTPYGLAAPESTGHDLDRDGRPRKKDGLPNFRKGGENHT